MTATLRDVAYSSIVVCDERQCQPGDNIIKMPGFNYYFLFSIDFHHRQ